MPPKYFKVKLEDVEIKPKSPVREKEFEFEELMVRNTSFLMDQNKKMLEELSYLRTKVELLEEKVNKSDKKIEDLIDDIILIVKTFKDKTLPLSERIMKAEEIQKNLLEEGKTVRSQRIGTEGISVVQDIKGIYRVIY